MDLQSPPDRSLLSDQPPPTSWNAPWFIAGAATAAAVALATGFLMRDPEPPATQVQGTHMETLSHEARHTPSDGPALAPNTLAAPAEAPARARPVTDAPPPRQRQAGTDSARAAPPVQRVCRDCGTVVAVDAVTRKGEANGTGAVIGGVVGGVVGNQMGDGNGRKAMTVLGAIGGGMAGHEIEKRRRATTTYAVRVRLDDGRERTFSFAEAPVSRGDRVVVEGNGLRRLS